MFQFKRFSVDQSNCAMKINTDGVLLGALAEGDNPAFVLDIGTGTGVIALMLAQRFDHAQIDAVEIDRLAAATAASNFENSVFEERLSVYPIGFEAFFDTYPEKKYDLIVSNPPFYINSLHSPEEKKQLAKHADKDFFESMLQGVATHLSLQGIFWLILPRQTVDLVKTIAASLGLYIMKVINVRSFTDKEPHREIVVFGFGEHQKQEEQFVIYKSVGCYTQQYQQALKEFFTIF
jgi:tRNA1Val (adenine37-N6)-methyltransferase